MALFLDELEDDWEVIEYSSTQIRLKDVQWVMAEQIFISIKN